MAISDRARRGLLLGGAATLAGASILLFAPGYLSGRGFPLDDAWIHAVYARSLAHAGMLAYNPGVPATGETAPLWALFGAAASAVTSSPLAMATAVKLIGFSLHVLTALFAFEVMEGSVEWVRLGSAALVLFQPDLIAASVSGMEVPLATACVLAMVWAVRRGSILGLAVIAAAAPLARPELACVGPLLIGGSALVEGRGRTAKLALAWILGTALSSTATALRNLHVSGRPLPATFYAKVHLGAMPLLAAEWRGFSDLLAPMPPIESVVAIALFAIVAIVVLANRRRQVEAGQAAVLLLTGVSYAAISFALVAPIDPEAFYHQRYVLPALPLLVLALVPLLSAMAAASPRLPPWTRRVPALALALLFCDVLAGVPRRLHHLDNDAHNIDDVQVREGRSLAAAAPTETLWAVDSGAVRYFGNARVVDMMGLNTPEAVGPGGDDWLAAHPPRYLELVRDWSQVMSPDPLPAHAFSPSTRYTVTSFPRMATHVLL
ncbi:MAG TPA: hypothetical protein VII38_08815, partial [Polyangia bacterium]